MIKFGTSGWRGIIADDFTFENVRIVTQAISEYVNKNSPNNLKSVIVGYDTRFLSDKYAELSAEVLAGNGIKALLCKRDTPTPVISFEIIRRAADGGINFTASHNPYNYNGLKFSPSWGGPALPETTEAIEKSCRLLSKESIKKINLNYAKNQGFLEYIDPRPKYLSQIKKLVNFNAIKKGRFKVAVDLLNGTATGYLDELLKDAGISCVITRDWRDVMFPKSGAPEPNRENLRDLYSLMKKESCSLGIATDGDADRFGILDNDGTFINPNEIISVLLYHLIKSRGWKGIVARSVMTTHLIDKIADKFGLQIKETPVGFKYIGEILNKEKESFVIGGEESGGLTIRGHVPEKDGILACLLVVEMISESKKSIKKILSEIYNLVGPVFSDRVNFRLSSDEMETLKNKLKEKTPDNFSGLKVKKLITVDGYKFIFENDSWLGIRLSGTEPVVRLYVEADSKLKIKNLISAGEKYIKGS
ncbi:MAG: phosphoglucomutase/phosphomannomutase family protein [Elusimicrobia bacterium]|nr:phosphoglucomutase/phosphomannomutase family protein [Elusimicrobiota bacterium]